ncbi:melanoma-derived growth regulatory protein [Acanthopagrus latus]|uniref:melanoma-derived growth regulatory protein n=1 Tax=Acanthopagrus latus TaxID=8177 RepID=UPI00187CDCCE|nr:melanoma-derived growth regulatory protein [Acanthopagrus latus]
MRQRGGRESRKRRLPLLRLLSLGQLTCKRGSKSPQDVHHRIIRCFFTYSPDMHCKLWLALSVCLLLPTSDAGRQMPKLSAKKLCADSECSHPILMARALQDYYPGDCRFIPIRQGQLIYVYAMLKDRGNLFWAGSVQDSYYGQQEARIGHFPSSVVEETHPLMPATTEVKTTEWDFYCN